MIIIADSGATKTDWRIVISKSKIVSFETKGLNPFFSSQGDFINELQNGFPKDIDKNEVKKIFFYGAGCAGEEKGKNAQIAIQNFFLNSSAYAYSDLLAAARALFGNNKGVIAILGTGSNIAFYNGEKIHHYTPSLGFVLGDEGSGAYIGRLILRDYYYNQLPQSLSDSLSKRYNLDLAFVLDNVYSKPRPSTYLASFIPFILENIENEYIYRRVKTAFDDLYKNHLAQIPELKEYGVGIIGSVGYLFRSFILDVARKEGFTIHDFLQYPIDNLTRYHILQDL